MAWITRESSNLGIWDYISRFQQTEYVERLYGESHVVTKIGSSKVNAIRSAFAQGRMYFESAANSPIGVAPVLLYYGVISLASGLAMFTSPYLDENNWPKNHGLKRVGWKEHTSNKKNDLLMLGVKSTEGTFSEVVKTVVHVHIEAAYTRKIGEIEAFPYCHRLGQVKFVNDGTIVTFDDLVSRSRYTGGHYGRSTKRQKRLHRGTVRLEGEEMVIGYSIGDEGVLKCLNKLSEQFGLEKRPNGVVFPRRDYKLNEPDLLPVFHQEESIDMSIIENFTNGDRLSEFIKLYLMAYILGMLARYCPSHWMDVVRDNSTGADHHLLLHATRAVQENFPREFAGQLAILTNDPYFFGEYFGETMSFLAGDLRNFSGTTRHPEITTF